MGQIKSFKDLSVWQLSMEVALKVYKLSNDLPKHETYALSDQIRRSAVSIPSNIAEGSKRNNRKEFNQFCGIAQGSAAELETQILLIQEVYKIDVADLLNQISRIQMMLTKLRQKLRTPTTPEQRPTNHDS